MWQLSKLKESDVANLYKNDFVSQTESLLSDLQSEVELITDRPELCIQPDFDFLNERLCNAVYRALDWSVGVRPSRPKHWHKYWTSALQKSAEYRDHCYKKWRHSSVVDKLLWWQKHQQAHRQFRHDVLVAKWLPWRDYCHSLEVDFDKAQSQIKY